MNDEDRPPKALISFDMFLIPMEDMKEGTAWKKTFYDLTGTVSLTVEDTLRLVKHLNKLLKAVFDDHNYVYKR
jgi:hypothetical protein